MENEIVTGIRAAIDAGIRIGAVTPHQVLPLVAGQEAMHVIVTPKDSKVEVLTPPRVRPRLRDGDVTVFTSASFVDYVNTFKDKTTLLFADVALRRVGAVLDYHASGDDGLPSYGVHHVTLALRDTPEWAAWMAGNGKKRSQLEFAEFLEDNMRDIAEPNGAALYEIATNMEAAKSAAFKSGVRLQDGRTQLTYHEQIDGSSNVNSRTVPIPASFTVALAPFEGAPKYSVTARLRYRIEGSKLAIWYDLLRPELVVQDAFNEQLVFIQEKTLLTPLSGVKPALRKL